MASDITISSLTVASGVGQFVLQAAWAAPAGQESLSYMQAANVEFWAASSNNRALASKVADGGTLGLGVYSGLGASIGRYFWARAVDPAGNEGAFYPVSATGGVYAATKSEVPPNNSVGSGQLQTDAVQRQHIAALAVGDAEIETLSASKLTAGIITALIEILGPTITGGIIRTADSGKRVQLRSGAFSVIDSLNRNLARMGATEDRAADFWNYSNDHVVGIEAALTSGNAHALRARNAGAGGGHGIVGVSFGGGGWAFYAESGNYGPFTGAHDGLLPKDFACETGDILVDVKVIARDGVDNTLTTVERSSAAKQRGVIGVLSKRAPYDPEAHLSGLPEAPNTFIKRHLAESYDRCTINGLGEGQINVCGLGGDLEMGDFICASAMPGKGQRQNTSDGAADDLHRRCTVARAREPVTFDYPEQVRRVACIYLCG